MSLFSIAVSSEPLASSAVETVVQLATSASKSARLVRWSVSFTGTSPTDAPVRVDLLRQTSAGTSSAYTPKRLDPSSDASLATGLTAFTAEPVSGDVLETYQVTPYAGLLVMQYAPDERPVVLASQRLGVRCLAAAAVNVSAYFVFEE